MSTVENGQDAFAGSTGVSSDRLNKTVLWRGTALPVGAANQIPQNGLFLLVDSLSAPTIGTLYLQTSTTLSTPTFVEVPTSVQANTVNILSAYPDPTVTPIFYADFLGDLANAVKTNGGYPYKWTEVSSGVEQGIIDDFSNYANDVAFDVEWVTSDATKIDPDAATEQIDIIGISGANNTKCFHDMGHTLSDEKFMVKGKFTIGTIGANNTSHAACGIMIRSTNIGPGSAGDLIFLSVNYRSNKTVFGIYGVNSGHGQNIGHEFTTIFPTNATTYYFILERNGTSTTFTATFYTDDTYSVPIEAKTETATGAMVGYRYAGPYIYCAGGSTNIIDMKVEKLEILNKVNHV